MGKWVDSVNNGVRRVKNGSFDGEEDGGHTGSDFMMISHMCSTPQSFFVIDGRIWWSWIRSDDHAE